MRQTVLRTIGSYAERSERYVRIYQHSHRDLFPLRHREHAAILDAVRGDDPSTAVALMARHLADTALRVIDDFAPGQDTTAVREAVALVAGPQLAEQLTR